MTGADIDHEAGAHRAPASGTSRWGFAEGDEIAPRLSVLRRLGGGHRYEAYLAFSEELWTTCVVKVVRPDLVDDEHTLSGLRSEVALLDRLSHPVIVRGFGSDLGGERPHVVLEHLEGPRLSTLLRKYGPLPAEQLVPLAVQLAAAIHYLDGAGVVHLDVKPSNVIMGAPPRLIDLSVALDAADAQTLTRPVGTDSYMAPEQCLPAELGPVGPPADVWGLGATLYRALSGEPAFGRAVEEPRSPEERWPQLVGEPAPLDGADPALAAPILSCLAREPAARPAAREVAEALEPVLGALPKPRLSRLKPRLRTAR
ncbi:MAG: serine/threonine-protein kinase [Solirubrobacterales bacterium]